jgi:dihydrolipoamide dehydrogenase
LRSAEIFEVMRHANDCGVAADNVRFDAESIIERPREITDRLGRGVEGLFKKNTVEVIWGDARLTVPGQITVAAPARQSNRPSPAQPLRRTNSWRLFRLRKKKAFEGRFESRMSHGGDRRTLF